MPNNDSASSGERVKLYSCFSACGYGSIEVANLFNHFKWVWPNMSKVIGNTELAIPNK